MAGIGVAGTDLATPMSLAYGATNEPSCQADLALPVGEIGDSMSLTRRPANSSIFFSATERIVNTITSTKDHLFVPTGANELYCIQKKKGGEQQPTAVIDQGPHTLRQ